ncbi:MAG: winged helix-turn-helix domain-containing protein [Aquamicrobium sp.]|uniref:helix-turn-helix transcriptional regulator n=1 Tax=Aquamicrobium sp. TaxID=1872579 RepID=UPI00349F0321|nr:winged helix-turn-helix domain-containing protein [Aquamicrobium sp.]MCO5157948.1 winged helix-turn-helix domain-containing protein [Aquamicrobium sp.]
MAGEKLEELTDAQRRGLFGRAMLDFLRETQAVQGVTSDLSRHCFDFVVGLAIVVGQGDGKELSVSDIAGYTGASRSTAWRALRRLEKLGQVRFEQVGNRKVVRLSYVDNPEVAVRLKAAATKLSKTIYALYP